MLRCFVIFAPRHYRSMGIADTDPTPICCLILASKVIRYRREGQAASSIPGTGLYNRQYSGASKPIAQSAASPASAPPQIGTGIGLKLFLAFLAGGVVFSIIGAMMPSSPVVRPAPPPAAVIVPVVPSPVAPVKRHAHSSKRAIAQGLPNPSARKADRTPQTPPHPVSDAAPPAN